MPMPVWAGQKGEPADKPGSVVDSHSSGTHVTVRLLRPTREPLRAAGHGFDAETGPYAPLFGLAPGGVYRAAACCHRRGALLPHLFTLATCPQAGSAVRFLWHFPWARAPQALPGTLPCGARTFLPSERDDAVLASATAWPTPLSDIVYPALTACRRNQARSSRLASARR